MHSKRHFSAHLSAPVLAHDEDEENSCTAKKAHYKFCFPVIANYAWQFQDRIRSGVPI